MSDVQVPQQTFGASGDTNSPVLGVDNTNDEDLSANVDDDGMDEAETMFIRSRIKERHDLLTAAHNELKDIEQMLKHNAHTDKEVIGSLRRLGFRAFHVGKYAHKLAARRLFGEMNTHYTDIDPHVAYAKIDVHYLREIEAKRYVRDHLNKCQRSGLSQTEIICGGGKNSKGVGKIRVALIKEFQCTGVQ